MKQICIFCLFLISIALSSQNFTNGSVYNYNVGDTIVTSYTQYMAYPNTQPPPMWTYRIFTGKHVSATVDTVYYTVHDVVSGFTCYPCSGVINSYNSTFAVTHLSDSVINFPFYSSSCGKRIDTSYVNTCGLWEHDAYLDYSQNDSGCFEPPTLAYRVIEGVGVFEHTVSLTAAYPNPSGFETRLEWFRKGSNRCGQVTAIPDGVKEYGLQVVSLDVYPNPSAGSYDIELGSDAIVSVGNVLGEEIFKASLPKGKQAIDLSRFPDGVYNLTSQTARAIGRAKLVKKN